MCRPTCFNCTTAGNGERKPFHSLWTAFVLAVSLGQVSLLKADDQLLQLNAEALDGALLSQQSAAAGLDLEHLEVNVQVNDSDQQALLQNNSISNSVTGNNAISDNAFAGASGISTVIQNTGNQVIIQGSTMVNVLINQ